MMKQRAGKIVNIASVVGRMGNVGQANYSASKAGVIALAKTTAKEFATRNIQVNAVAPGFIETAMTEKLPQEARDAFLTVIPARRGGRPGGCGERGLLPLLARLGLRDRAGHQCRRRHVDVILSCFPALFRVGKCKKSEIFQELNLTFAVPGGILSQ